MSRAGVKLIGRDQPLRVLRTALRAAPGLVLVVGEAGVGKSRLVAEARSSHPARWLVAQCHAMEDQVPLSPIIEALGKAVLRSGTRHAVFTSVLDHLTGTGSTVLLIEDLHWADPGTLQLLRFLAGRLPRELVLIATYRQEDTRHAGEITALAGGVPSGARATEVRLHPLDRSGVHDLAAELVGAKSLPPELIDELVVRTGGLPFVVEELLRDESIGKGPVDTAAIIRAWARKPAPVALRASLTIRMQQIPEFSGDVIRAAAVLDIPAAEALLGAVADVNGHELTSAMDAGLARGLLGEPKPGLYDLRQTLARRAIYETIPPDEVRRLHRRAAAALAAVDPPHHAQIAVHSRLGGSLRDWMIHAELAADQAHSIGEDAVAAQQLIEMLQVEALSWGDRARLAVKLGRVAASAEQWESAIAILEAVQAESAVAGPVRGRLRLALGLLQEQVGDIRAGRRELSAAISELGKDQESVAWALSALAVPTAGAESIAEQRALLDRALHLVGDDPEGDAQLAVRRNQARVRLALGEVDEADGVEIASGLAWLGYDRRSTALLDRAAETENAFIKRQIAATRARLDFATGNWTGLADRLARTRLDAAGLPLLRAELDLVDGRLRLAQGDVGGGRQLLDSVLQATVDGPWPVRVAAAAALDRYADAPLDECVDLVIRKDGWAWAGELIARAVLRREDSHRLAADFAAALAEREAPAATAAATFVRAVVEDSAELFGVAAEQYRALGRRYDECIALEERGVRLLAAGQPAELVATASAYEAMGARGDARRCRTVLREAGISVRPKRGRRGYGKALSPRELEVARLAADGLSNSRIAAKLTLSVSTVEDHLSHAMRKLEVRSRRDLGPLITP